ncbi:MAG: PAS-domain containing protein [Alphaproteobacteria bacterium]|nr:PAS-domain containing protein [Alphaproteobacteria bacterium]
MAGDVLIFEAFGVAALGFATVGAVGLVMAAALRPAAPRKPSPAPNDAEIRRESADETGYHANSKAAALLGRAQFLRFDEVFRRPHPGPVDPERAMRDLFDFGVGFQIEAEARATKRRLRLESREKAGTVTLRLTDISGATEGSRQSGDTGSAPWAVWDALPFPAWRRDPETLAVMGANQAYWRALGLEKQSRAHLAVELGAGAIGEFGRALARRAAVSGAAQSERHHVVVNGERRLYQFTETPLPDLNVLIGHAIDQTPLEEAQSQTLESQAVQRAVLERMVNAIAIYGADRRLTFFNQAFCAMWGLRSRDLADNPAIGEVLDQLIQGRRMPEIIDVPAYKRAREALFTNLVEPTQELLHLPDERTVKLTIAPHPSGGLMFIFEDVTDRISLERSFNTLTKVQQATLNNLYEGVAVFGADGRLRLSNARFPRLWNLTDADVAGGPHISELVDRLQDSFAGPGDWALFKARRVQEITAPRPNVGRMELRPSRILDYADVPLPDGQCLMLLLDVTDTTNVRRALEDRNAALQNADLLKAQFISNMSYELRTPLNAIVGFSEMLKSGLAGPLNDRQSDYVSNTLSASTLLAKMVSDLLDLAAIQAGFLELSPERLSVRDLLSDVAAEVQAEAAEKNVVVEIDPADEDLTLEGDKTRIREALALMAGNAITVSPANSVVRVTARSGPISTPNSDQDGDVEPDMENGVRFTIEDSGASDSIDERIRSFEDFTRAGGGQSDRFGVGLSLALARSLIELHGGTIAFRRADAGGGCFLCALPKVQIVSGRKPVGGRSGLPIG